MDPNDDLLYGCPKLCEMIHNSAFFKNTSEVQSMTYQQLQLSCK